MAISLIPAASAVSGTLPAANLPTGSVLQVIQGTTSTQTSTTSTTFADTTLSASITPKFSTSKILVMVNQSYRVTKSSTGTYGGFRLVRGSTPIWISNTESGGNPYSLGINAGGATNAQLYTTWSIQYLDSPATTSSTTYKTQFATYDNVTTMITQLTDATACSAYIQLLEIAG
jgi:hypothetical protein